MRPQQLTFQIKTTSQVPHWQGVQCLLVPQIVPELKETPEPHTSERKPENPIEKEGAPEGCWYSAPGPQFTDENSPGPK